MSGLYLHPAEIALLALAAATDVTLAPADFDFTDLFLRGWLRTHKHDCDRYETVLTDYGREQIKAAIIDAIGRNEI